MQDKSSVGEPEPASLRSSGDELSRRRLLMLTSTIAIGSIPLLLDRAAIAEASELVAVARSSATPYFMPEHAWLLYARCPLVVLSACLFLLAPGLLLSISLGSARNVGQWLITGLGLSIIELSVLTAVAQTMAGGPVRGNGFLALTGVSTAVGLLILIGRLARGDSLAWPLSDTSAATKLASIIVVPWSLLVAMAPKFFWESFNGDGAHAFESSRLLLFQPMPFWDRAAGEIAGFPGTTTMLFAYPASWFIRLFGELEVSARLPLLLFIVALFGVVVALSELERRRLEPHELWLVWLALIAYVLTMGYSATYDPYTADIALPATQDTLAAACVLGAIMAFSLRSVGWFFVFAGLAFTSATNGFALLVLFLSAVSAAWRPRPVRQLAWAVGALLTCILGAMLLPVALRLGGHPLPGSEHGLMGMLRKFAFLQVTDWWRLAFVVIPCGILPAGAMAAWSRQDRLARSLTLLTLAYFVLFYIQAYVSLHYFAPVMLIPLVVFWRVDLLRRYDWPLRAVVTGAAGALAVYVSLPEYPGLFTGARTVGEAVEDRIGGYERLAPEAFRRSTMLRELFPSDWEASVPEQTYGGSPLAWYYYAHRPGGRSKQANYIIRRAATEAQDSALHVVAEDKQVQLCVRDRAQWAEHRAMRPPTPAGSRIYQIPRGRLFGREPIEDGPTIINVVGCLQRIGVDMDSVLDRLGVEPRAGNITAYCTT